MAAHDPITNEEFFVSFSLSLSLFGLAWRNTVEKNSINANIKRKYYSCRFKRRQWQNVRVVSLCCRPVGGWRNNALSFLFLLLLLLLCCTRTECIIAVVRQTFFLFIYFFSFSRPTADVKALSQFRFSLLLLLQSLFALFETMSTSLGQWTMIDGLILMKGGNLRNNNKFQFLVSFSISSNQKNWFLKKKKVFFFIIIISV